MTYESVAIIESQHTPGITYTVAKMSYTRRVELMRTIRELARKMEFLQAGTEPSDRMDAALLEAEINRLYVMWGLREISGLILDGVSATPQLLAERGPEELFREALMAVREQTGLSEAERKNCLSPSIFSFPTRPVGGATAAEKPAWNERGDVGG
ncbi:MAG: hypothetical protein C5B51_17225 [Terriglobia bacterium]|nr:MAG: hypothetical protein C5B51_17225 [Terriglobia bacterium]